MKKMGRRPEQPGQPGQPGPQQQGGQGEGRPPVDRRPERRPPRERRFDKPADEKPAEGGEFSVEKWVNWPFLCCKSLTKFCIANV